MSETEEPPAKLIKIENNNKEITIPNLGNTSTKTPAKTSEKFAEGNSGTEVMQTEDIAEEGQEEWLSEGILTDDDYTPNAENIQRSEDSQSTENNDTTTTEPAPEPIPTPNLAAIRAEILDLNIEETLNRMDGKNKEDSLEENLDAFMEKSIPNTSFDKNNDLIKPNEDDGNDTDDLLRMLGEDNVKTKKKLTKTVKDIRHNNKNADETTDEEDFEYDDSSAKKVKAAKSAISKKSPPKAVHEDVGDGDNDETDLSSDDASKKEPAKKKVYTVKKPNSVAKKVPPAQNLVVVKKTPEVNQILNVIQKPGKIANTKQIETKQVVNKTPTRSILKTSAPVKIIASTPMTTRAQVNKEPVKKLTIQPPVAKTPAPLKSNSILKPTITKAKTDQVEEEKVEDEEMGHQHEVLDSEFEEELSKTRQRIMKPEQMEEEAPSDGDSHSDDVSLYDEMPSSDSDDMDDWFQIDVRSERASDYLPLLGAKARDLLLEEKKRVGDRITTLRQSLSALTDSGKRQAEQLRSATMNLAEIDDLLKAT